MRSICSKPIKAHYINKWLKCWSAQHSAAVMLHGSCSTHSSRGQPFLQNRGCPRAEQCGKPKEWAKRERSQMTKRKRRGSRRRESQCKPTIFSSVVVHVSPTTDSGTWRQEVSCPLGTGPWFHTWWTDQQPVEPDNKKLLARPPAQPAAMDIPNTNTGCFQIPLNS